MKNAGDGGQKKGVGGGKNAINQGKNVERNKERFRILNRNGAVLWELWRKKRIVVWGRAQRRSGPKLGADSRSGEKSLIISEQGGGVNKVTITATGNVGNFF